MHFPFIAIVPMLNVLSELDAITGIAMCREIANSTGLCIFTMISHVCDIAKMHKQVEFAISRHNGYSRNGI